MTNAGTMKFKKLSVRITGRVVTRHKTGERYTIITEMSVFHIVPPSVSSLGCVYN